MKPLEFSRCCIYLRKSRKDIELEAAGAEDTLQRHRRQLIELSRQYNLTVSRIYEEVVTGDTISGRPQMQLLLKDVELGLWDVVLCMDIDRLGRGGMRDQGLILDTFKYSGTSVLTPDRLYQLDNEMDEEAMEYKTQGARFEYRMIKKRLARGRQASIKEGKFIGHTPPYGYERFKLEKQKGWSLRPVAEQADVVRMIYNWYTGSESARIGISKILRRLNDMLIPSPGGNDWLNCTVRSILTNPVYTGKIRAGYRRQKKNLSNGELILSRPRNTYAMVYDGLHEAIISEEQFALAQEYMSKNKGHPGPKQYSMINPLSGLIICEGCGRAMVRRPYNSGRTETLLCPYTSCHGSVSSDLCEVEEKVLDGLSKWLAKFSFEASCSVFPSDGSEEIQAIEKALAAAAAERNTLEEQKRRAYDFVEQGIYSIDVFTSRMTSIGERLSANSVQEDALQSDLDRLKQEMQARRQLVPNIRFVLDAYPLANTPEEKNALLRSVLDKVIYHKTTRARSLTGSDLSLTLLPKFHFL